jgi:5-methylcytosine-specific restriction endonuclease McrA
MNEILHHPSSASLEHVIPESRGGPTEEWNLAVACRACNYGRGDRYLAIETELERAQ